ncbi:MAG: hypothetical protein Q4B54_13935, partial [Coriobacteriales bacterium]|nr:hypothetical protein [Coriobacteriales bacterium]
MAHENENVETQRSESVEELVARADADELRAFVISVAHESDAFERKLRASFGLANANQAAQELERVTKSLWNKYERRGFIGWNGAADFAYEYGTAVGDIMRPLLLAKDAGALIDLVIPRLVQLQQICIDDSDGFYTTELSDVDDDLNQAFELADAEQSVRLLGILTDFLEENPGDDYAEIYEYEQELVMEFLRESFARDERFASAVIELANPQVERLTAEQGDARGYAIRDREAWAQMCLVAQVTQGRAPNELHAYAQEYRLLENADVIRMLANAYVEAGAPREAAAIVRENLDARDMPLAYSFVRHSPKQPRLVEYLEKLAGECYDQTELAELYRELLVRNWGFAYQHRASSADLNRWYDALRCVTDASAWDDVRAELLGAVPYATANALLEHEGLFEELYQRIMSNDGNGLITYERVLCETHPEPYVNYYLREAKSLMDSARGRNDYKQAASQLVHAAGIKGGKDRAQALALEFAAEYPRRT